MPMMEQVVEATMVNAEVPNLSLKEPSLTARAEPEGREARRGCRSEGRGSSLSDQDEEAGSDAIVWEKVGEESDSEGRDVGKAKARSRACDP
jgi:hypothetical protein